MVKRSVFQAVLEDYRLEAASAIHVAQLRAAHVVRDGAFFLGDGRNIRRGHVQKLGIGIDKSLDQPWAGDSVDARILSGYPFHRHFLLALLHWHTTGRCFILGQWQTSLSGCSWPRKQPSFFSRSRR